MPNRFLCVYARTPVILSAEAGLWIALGVIKIFMHITLGPHRNYCNSGRKEVIIKENELKKRE